MFVGGAIRKTAGTGEGFIRTFSQVFARTFASAKKRTQPMESGAKLIVTGSDQLPSQIAENKQSVQS
jgi:hypothetical protein